MAVYRHDGYSFIVMAGSDKCTVPSVYVVNPAMKKVCSVLLVLVDMLTGL